MKNQTELSNHSIKDIETAITPLTNDDIKEPVYDPPPPTEEARLRCDLWISCDLEYCKKHGCVNALMQNRKELRL